MWRNNKKAQKIMYILASIFLHILLASTLLLSINFNKESNKKDNDRQNTSLSSRSAKDKAMQIIEKSNKVEVSLIEVPKGNGFLNKKVSKNKCTDWYGGIGVDTHFTSNGSYIITSVASGYPAANAGLMSGDIVINLSDTDIRGEVGTPITITVLRGVLQYSMTMLRDRICYLKSQRPI